MKKLGLLFGFFFMLLANTVGAADNPMYTEASKLYQAKLYDSSANLFLQLIEKGNVHPTLFYNAGNAFYRSNKIGMAIWCYKKSLQLQQDKNCTENLKLAEMRMKDPIAAVKDIFFIRWWKSVYSLFSLNGWAGWSLAFFLFGMGLLFYKKIKASEDPSKTIITMSMLASAICLFFLIVLYIHERFHYKGIIVEPYTFFRKDIRAEGILISEGMEVEFKGNYKTDVLIILPDGREGQIPATAFRKL